MQNQSYLSVFICYVFPTTAGWPRDYVLETYNDRTSDGKVANNKQTVAAITISLTGITLLYDKCIRE